MRLLPEAEMERFDQITADIDAEVEACCTENRRGEEDASGGGEGGARRGTD
jgi:hypothetical protein